MLSELWGIYGAKFHCVAHASATTLGGILRQGIGIETRVEREPTSGEPYARWAAIHAQNFRPSLATRAIETALGLTGLQSMKVNADGSHPGLVLYAQKQEDGSSRATGSVHGSFTIKKGVIIPLRLTCEHQGDAELEYMVLPTFDTTNDPVVFETSVALPTAPTDTERFTLGPVTLATIELEGFTRMEIDFGINAQTLGADSSIWDVFARVESALPSITLSGMHVTGWGSSYVPTTGLICAHANTSLFLRKRKLHSTFEADNASEHYKFTACGLATVTDGFQANGNSPAECALRIDTTFDGTTIPLFGAANQAIA
jgi:hypothetical protein